MTLTARLLLIFIAFSASAHAQEPSPSEELAAAEFEAARVAFRAGEYERAAAGFRAALTHHPEAKSACNLALTYDRMNDRLEEARDAYVRCAELDTEGRYRDHALERTAALRREIAARPPDVEDPPTDPERQPPQQGEALRAVGPQPAQPFAPAVTIQQAPARSRGGLWAGIALTAIGTVTMAAAAGVSVAAAADEDELLDKYPDRMIDPTDRDAILLNNQFERRQTTANVLFATGGGLIGVGIVLIAIDVARHSSSENESGQVSVSPHRDGAMATYSLSF